MSKTEKKSLPEKGGKRIRNIRKLVEDKSYSLEEAISLLKQVELGDSAHGIKPMKFDATCELIVKLGIDARQSDQNVRGAVPLPHGTGKAPSIAVFCDDATVKQALDAGAKYAGSQLVLDKIKAGDLDFDICIALLSEMPKVSQAAKVLGPKGMMPNPKLGTVVQPGDLVSTIESAIKGRANFRNDKAGIIHVATGKASFATNALIDNIKAIMQAIVKAKPTGSKGVYLRAAYLSTTMGPGVKLDIATVTN